MRYGSTIPRGELDMVVALHDIDIKLSVRRCFKDSLIDAELGQVDCKRDG